MLTGVSDSLTGISRTIALLTGAVWALALIILLITFTMMVRERRREFAVLRLLGASRGGLSRLMLSESALCSLVGGLCGVIVAAAGVFPFTRLIETKLGLPYLTPSVSMVLLTALAAAAGTVLAGVLSSAWAAGMLSRADPGTVLRGE
jgi:putative ABC transport system permease protein